jgi:hypothetical protein
MVLNPPCLLLQKTRMSSEINFVDNAAAPRQSHYIYLLGIFYDSVLSYSAFLSVVVQVSRNLCSPISTEKAESFAPLSY